MPKSYQFTHKEFNELWQKIEIRYEKETKSKLRPKEHKSLLTYLRQFPDVNFHLPNSSSLDSEGQAIYRRYLDAKKPEKDNPIITLGIDFAMGLISYANGHPVTPIDIYYKHLRSFYTRPGNLNDTNLSLQDIYIEPIITDRISYLDADNHLIIEELSNEKLSDIVINWIKGERKISPSYNRILFLLGDPGQGKTSFCYRILHNIAGYLNRPVIFYRLRYTFNVQKFFSDPFATIYENLIKYGLSIDDEKYNIDLTEEDFFKSILILDGLDELEKIYGLDKDDFCLRIAQLTQASKYPYKIVVTSRKEVDANSLNSRGIKCWFLSELTIDEQYNWIKKYNSISASQYNIRYEQLEFLNNPELPISPLLKQPILLHIIAQLNILPNENYNSGKVYDELFSRLLRRYWTNYYSPDDKHPVLSKYIFTPDQLRYILQKIGLEMFRQGSSSLSHKNIPNDIVDMIGIAEDKQLNALKTLLIAFYFNFKVIEGQKRLYAIEFLHNTFGEYLASEAIWVQFKSIFHSKEKSIGSILQDLALLFKAPQFITKQLCIYLSEIIINERIDQKTPTNEQNNLSLVMTHYLESLFKCNFFSASAHETDTLLGISQSFFGFFFIYTRIHKSVLYSPEYSSYRPLFSKYINMVILDKGEINFDYSNVDFINFSRIDFKNSSFIKTSLRHTNFNFSKLFKVNFTGSDLSSSEFEFADLRFSSLQSTKISNVNFKGADMTSIDMKNLEINNSFLNETKLLRASFDNSRLENVKFIYTIASGCSFKNTFLASVNFLSANLIGSDFSNATLIDVDFRNADLSNSMLFNVDLSQIKLNNSNLEFCDITGSKNQSFESLSVTKCLHDCIGIDDELLLRLRRELPELFKVSNKFI